MLRLIEKASRSTLQKKSRRKPLPKKVAKRDFLDLEGLYAEDDENDEGAANALHTLQEMNHIDENILIEPVSDQHLRAKFHEYAGHIHETCKKSFIGPEMDIGVCAVCDRLFKEVSFRNVFSSSSFSFSAMDIFPCSLIPIFSQAFLNMFADILILHPCN